MRSQLLADLEWSRTSCPIIFELRLIILYLEALLIIQPILVQLKGFSGPLKSRHSARGASGAALPSSGELLEFDSCLATMAVPRNSAPLWSLLLACYLK